MSRPGRRCSGVGAGRGALVTDGTIDEVIPHAGDQEFTLTGDRGSLPDLVKPVLEPGHGTGWHMG